MKKKFILVLMALTLTGCSQSTGDTQDFEELSYKEFVTLGDYTGFSIEVPKIEITEDEVAAALDNLVQTNVTYENSGETVVEDGDCINFSYKIFEDGSELEDYAIEKYQIIVGNGNCFEELETQLVGLAVGEEHELTVAIDEQYYDQNLAGKELVFKVTIHSIDNIVKPEVTDAWITSVSDSESVEDWKIDIKSELEAEERSEQQQIYFEGIKNKIMENAKFESIPESSIKAEIEEYKEGDTQTAESMGYTFEEFITNYYGYAGEEEYLADLKAYVEEVIQLEWVLDALKDKEGITMSDSDLDNYISECVEVYGFTDADEFKEYYGEDTIKEACHNSLVWDKLGELNSMVEVDNYYE